MLGSIKKKRIGILRGGAGEHYENSLTKGGNVISYVLENLSDKYKVVDIFIDRDNVWHIGGIPVEPTDLMHRVDIVLNVAHPSFSNILKNLSIPHIRSNSSSILETSRAMLNEHIKNTGINLPRHIVFPFFQEDFDGDRKIYANRKAQEVFEKFPSPWIVKSFNNNSGAGVHMAKTFPELVKAIEDVVSHGDSVLVEELIAGKSVSVHSLNNFRGQDVYVFPPAENRNGNIITPGNFSSDEKIKLIALSKNLHQYLNTPHYSKFDFVLRPKKSIYLVNIDFLPDLEKNSNFSKCCESVGTKPHTVLEHVLDLALI